MFDPAALGDDGGDAPSSSTSSSWSSLPPMPTPRTSLGAGVAGPVLFAVGGDAAVPRGTFEAFRVPVPTAEPTASRAPTTPAPSTRRNAHLGGGESSSGAASARRGGRLDSPVLGSALRLGLVGSASAFVLFS